MALTLFIVHLLRKQSRDENEGHQALEYIDQPEMKSQKYVANISWFEFFSSYYLFKSYLVLACHEFLVLVDR